MSAGFFESFYQSPIQHPVLLWLSNLLGTTLALVSIRTLESEKRSGLRNFILLWALISALDAWLSANQVFGLGVLSAPYSSIVPFLFVWAGDYRIFLAMDSRKFSSRGVAACFVVPILAGILTRGQEPRILFLVYEALFLVWILLYSRFTNLNKEPAARMIRNLSLGFYTLWVVADLLILSLSPPWNDLGFAVRVIPNLIYYGAFGLVCARAWRLGP
ncbi:MAG: hypothetical protein KGP28_03550 [Bdellovibrionales bacterium]|nr:hypothetical protein [Bdellovibrionales bacterium]